MYWARVRAGAFQDAVYRGGTVWRGLPFLAIAVLSLFLAAFNAQAHEGADSRLGELDHRLRDHPDDALAHLERGQLRHETRQWTGAIEDFDAAGRLNPDLPVIDLFRARTLLASGQPGPALQCAERYIEHSPRGPEGHLVRARILRVLGMNQEAASAFTNAIALDDQPSPELFLERADTIAAQGADEIESAVRSLDEGIARLGPLASLELAALDGEIRLRRYEPAIARIELLKTQAANPAHWLLRQAEVLELAGRADRARAAYQQALEALGARPDHATPNRAVVELEHSARVAIARIDGQAAVAAPPGESILAGVSSW